MQGDQVTGDAQLIRSCRGDELWLFCVKLIPILWKLRSRSRTSKKDDMLCTWGESKSLTEDTY